MGKREIEIEQIERIGRLAKLAMTDEEKSAMAEKLNNVLNHFNKIKAANTNSNLEPLLNPTISEFVYREDEVASFEGAPKAFLENAPAVQGRLYKTPPVV